MSLVYPMFSPKQLVASLSNPLIIMSFPCLLRCLCGIHRLRRLIGLFIILVPVSSLAAGPVVEEQRVVYTTSGPYEDFMEDLKDAVLARGMVVSNTSYVGKMLKRTAKNLGESKVIFHQAEVIEFCSAVVSRRALTADPHSIIYCPYRIAVYTLPEKPEEIYIAFPRLKATVSNDGVSQQTLQDVEDMLKDIIEEAIE